MSSSTELPQDDAVGARNRALVFVTIFVVALLLRWPWQQQGLWADEFFSLAVATGHSLEHAAADANASLGDFVEGSTARPASEWRSYLEHAEPPASVSRIIRAVSLSDTSPPLYYVLLAFWTRAVGTTDFSLRLFSVFWALASLPVLWSLGRSLGGVRVAASACALYAVAPVSVYYSLEGRMYSLLWFLAASMAWITLRLQERGVRPVTILMYCVCGAAGFLTHYFFAFVWVGCAIWIAWHPGRTRRVELLAAFVLTGLLVLPWYLQVPESLGRWRVTAGWLDGTLSWRRALTAPVRLAWSLLSGRGVWGGLGWMDRASAVLFLLVGLAALIKGFQPLVRPRVQLVWLWVAAACLGPLAFDLWRGTLTTSVPRYAIAGMPAAMLLTGVLLGRLDARLNACFLVLCVVAWLPGLRPVLTSPTRIEPYRQVGEELAAWATPSDLVIVHSIPSGVIGIARYTSADVNIAAWVGQLKVRRVPDDLLRLIAGRNRVAVIRIHEVGEPAPEESWLRENSRLVGQRRLPRARVLYFEPAEGRVFRNVS
jgi:hypothetical protein